MENAIPEFRLPDEQGRPWGSRDLLNRREMVLVLVPHAGCEECRRVLQVLGHRQEMGNVSGAAVLAVASGEGQGELQGMVLPFPLLHDADGQVGRELARSAGLPEGEAAIVVADRSGRIEWATVLHGEDPEVLVDAAIDSLDRAGAQCPG